MKVVIIGATGNVGSRTMNSAVRAGHEVTAYVRRPEAVAASKGIRIVKGNAEDTVALTEAAKGSDAIIVAITGAIKDTSFMQRNIASIVKAAKAAHVRRIILVSAFGAGDTADKAAWFMKLAYRTVLGKFFRDKAAADAFLEQSGLDYTIVYPVNLKDAPASFNVIAKPLAEVAKVPGMPTLPFASVAQEIVAILSDPHSIGQRMLITTARGWTPRQ
ncbi:MAG: NAD(P)-binding oxidoreductase [Bifidobacterium aquikefiri]|uniref:NmrA-like family protein n=1 Tax=Bifidobacterium aquikefiri TaxID=1653207 RepID=A0A261G122_9BIFI|nr:NAD(P)-binding oxidoreductase [Bifidobacterium aquikefiri]OZG65134.1 nmrA-like family protein [Bifidobacterium aquikefiri]